MKLFKVRKKGKTGGRPSKVELLAETMAEYTFKKYYKQFAKAYKDSVIYSEGVVKLKWKQ